MFCVSLNFVVAIKFSKVHARKTNFAAKSLGTSVLIASRPFLSADRYVGQLIVSRDFCLMCFGLSFLVIAYFVFFVTTPIFS